MFEGSYAPHAPECSSSSRAFVGLAQLCVLLGWCGRECLSSAVNGESSYLTSQDGCYIYRVAEKSKKGATSP